MEVKEVIFKEDDASQGLHFISLVASPATEIRWVTLSKDNPVSLQLKFQDKEKRIVLAPALIPNQKIYRNQNGEEFEIFFSADTIQKIAEHNVKSGVLTKTDVEHSQQLIPGITFFEQVVLSKDRYNAPKGFEGLPEGTLMLTGVVRNDDVAAKIESGEITGISIDGLFSAMSVKQTSNYTPTDEEIASILTKILSPVYT